MDGVMMVNEGQKGKEAGKKLREVLTLRKKLKDLNEFIDKKFSKTESQPLKAVRKNSFFVVNQIEYYFDEKIKEINTNAG